MAQILQQERAEHALKRVQELKDKVNQKEFRSYASSMPAMIKTNGLGQTAAFYFSQGETYRALYKIVSDWLKTPKQPYAGMDLLEGITTQDMHAYRVAQVEALLLLDWVKRFAKAYMRDENE